MTMKYIAPSSSSLIEALSRLAPDCSKTTLRSWIKDGRVAIDEEVVKRADHEVIIGQTITVSAKPRIISGNVRVIYDDPHLVVIDKPAGMLSVSTAFEKGETAFRYLKAVYGVKRVQVVHRLDQDTSGVMMFALSEKAKDLLKEMFERHEVKRDYVALVEGKMEEKKGSWESYLYEDANYVVKPTNDSSKGKLAITHFELIGYKKNFSRLRLKLETGRKNQIRVHCQIAGHPVVGDKKYGAKSNMLKRLGLHADRLSFFHPILKKEMTFTSPIPAEFNRLVEEEE